MKMKRLAPLAACAIAMISADAKAQDTYKIGVSAGLTGYAAAVDRSWRDGLEVAADYLNSHGGIMGRKVQVIVEDNKSEPQEAVTVYRKMISSDKVEIFLSGCVSAGNFAAAPFVVRAEIPMVLCSILPPKPDQVQVPTLICKRILLFREPPNSASKFRSSSNTSKTTLT
jgi:branched-chain amino acid transport system substrate-binding protein